MGSTYSIGPLPKDLEDCIGNYDIVDLKFMLLKFVRQRGDKNPFFLRINDVKTILKIDSIKAFKVMMVLDRANSGVLNYVDFWGGLAMIIRSSPDEKVAFSFELMDINEDKQMFPHEVFTLLRCVTRSVANIKGNKYVPLESISDLMRQLLKSKRVKLTETGEITMIEFRNFLLSNDSSRIYLSNLSSQVNTENKLKLLDNRNDILNNIEALNLEISSLENQMNWKAADVERFIEERGGDTELFTLESTQDENANVLTASASQESAVNKQAISDLNSQLAILSGASTYFDNFAVRNVNEVPDGAAFDLAAMSNATGAKSSNAGQKHNARIASLIFFWNKASIDMDGLVVFDEKFLNQICNVIGLELKPNERADCLEYVSRHKNQLNRSHPQTMIDWMNDVYSFMSQTSFEILDNFSAFCQKSYFGFLGWINTQIISLNNEYQLCREFEKYMHGNLLYSSTMPTASLKGYQALSTWQRVRQAALSSKFTIRCEFGDRPKKPVVAIPGDKASKSKAAKFTASKFVFAKDWKGVDISIDGKYKSKLDFRASIDSDHITCTMEEFKAFDNKQVAQLGINTLKIDFPDEKYNVESFPCIQWFSVKLNDSVSLPTAKCLLIIFKRALNYFKAWVDGYFPVITGNVVSILPEEEPVEEEAESNSFLDSLKGKKKAKMKEKLDDFDPFGTFPGGGVENKEFPKKKKKNTQVLLIIFFSTINLVEELEEQLPPGLLITRCLKNFSFKLQTDQTFPELLEKMFSTHNFSQKLFGPQEEEMSEEMKNPLNFMAAKKALCKDLAFKIMNPEKVKLDEMKSLFETKGYKTDGNLDQMNKRVNRLLRNYLNMVLGGGELSAFGKSITDKLFKIASNGTSKLGFWALNAYIDRFDSKTLFDNREYIELLESESIQTTVGHEGRTYMTKAGFDSYYERLGQLRADCAKLRIGSLDEILSGITMFQVEYDPDAVMSLFSLIDNTSYTWVKELLNYFLAGINKNSVIELKTDSLHSYIKRFLDVELPFLSNIDGFIQAIEDFQSMFANGDKGFIPSLRGYTKNTFGKYFEWDDIFADFIFKLEEHNVEERELAAQLEETENGGNESTAGSGGGQSSVGSRPGTSASKKSAPNDGKGENETDSMMMNQASFMDYLDRFNEILPPVARAKSFRQQSKQIQKEKSFLSDMLENESDRLSRKDIDDIKKIIESIDSEFSALYNEKAILERSMFAYCLVLYDAFRIFCDEFLTFGIGFEEFTISGTVSGILFNNFSKNEDDKSQNGSEIDKSRPATSQEPDHPRANSAASSKMSTTLPSGASPVKHSGSIREMARSRTESELESKADIPKTVEGAPFRYNLFLKGDGDRPYSQQFIIDKLGRSIQRKQNAIATLRRQKMKRQDELDGKAYSAEKQNEDEMYEFQLLSEIQEISRNDTTTMERYSKAQFKRLSRKWEEFGQFYMQNNLFPLKLIISLNNSAVASIMAQETESLLQNIDIMEVAANTAVESFITVNDSKISSLTAKDLSNPQVFSAYFIVKNYISVLNANKMKIPNFATELNDHVSPIVANMPSFANVSIIQSVPGFFIYLLPFIKEVLDSSSETADDFGSLGDDDSLASSSGNVTKNTKFSKNTKASRASTVEKIDKIRQRRELYDLIASNEISKIFQNVASGKTDVADFAKYTGKHHQSTSDDKSAVTYQSYDAKSTKSGPSVETLDEE